MSEPRPRASRMAPFWLLLAATTGLLTLPGSTCSTGNPGTVFDPDNPGGGGGGGGEPPREPGPRAAPVDGALILSGAPRLLASAPADDVGRVDVLAPIALWFSESLQPGSVNAQSLVVQPEGLAGVGRISTTSTWLAGNRCLVLQPSVPLAPNTSYEVVANDDVLDLDGARLKIPANGVLFRFKTATQTVGLAPRVLGSFPPAGAVNQASDHPAIVVFSKPMDFTGISGAVSLRNLTTAADADYDRSADEAFRHAGNRVFEFPHLTDGLDLNAEIRLRVETTVTDADFFPHPLEAAYSVKWRTLQFARPAGVTAVDDDPGDPFAPAVNGVNFDAFPVDVVPGDGAQPDDALVLLAHAANDEEFVQRTRRATTSPLRYELDLSDPAGPGTLFGTGGEVVLAAFAERGNRRSTVQVIRDGAGEPSVVPVDTVAPSLLNFGPPSGLFGSQFVADVPELRAYGRATEPVGRVRVSFPAGGPSLERDAFAPPTDGFFVGPSFPLGATSSAPFPFDLTLTDDAGNEAVVPLPASAIFRGFVGSEPLTTGEVRVIAYDQATLFPIAAAAVYIQSLTGGGEDFGLTGSDGSITFAARTGRQIITVIAEGRQTVTVYGGLATEYSLLMPETSEPVANPAAGITGVSTGITSVSSNLLAQDDAFDDGDFVQTVDLDQLFGSGLTARLQRLGWYAAFHDVAAFPAGAGYFRFFAQDPRILLQPSIGAAVQSPSLPMVESTNELLATADYQYPLSVALGAGFDLPASDASALALARVPGLDGPAAVGIGAVSGVSGEVEVELELHAAAVAEGAPAGTVLVQACALDDDGDFALARAEVALAAAPGAVALTMPGIPEANAAWTGASYPFTRSFSSTLAAGDGYYRVVIRDDQPIAGTWQIWVPSSVGVSGSITLPTLRESPSDPIGTPPLASDPGASWTAYVESFDMGAFSELGFFFSALRRDCLGFARSMPGPALNF